MLEMEPGPVNNELRQDYIPTNNTPILLFFIGNPSALGNQWPKKHLHVPRTVWVGPWRNQKNN